MAQQPITLALLFGHNFKSYKSNIFGNLPIEETIDISYGVSLIDYDGEGEDSYWLIKNQWDITWVRLDMKK